MTKKFARVTVIMRYNLKIRATLVALAYKEPHVIKFIINFYTYLK